MQGWARGQDLPSGRRLLAAVTAVRGRLSVSFLSLHQLSLPDTVFSIL